MKVKPFTKNDWYGFAGAEPFADGSEPMIGYDNEQNIMVIADGTGISLVVYSGPSENPTEAWYYWQGPANHPGSIWTPDLAERTVQAFMSLYPDCIPLLGFRHSADIPEPR
jgi:hypothetical protein